MKRKIFNFFKSEPEPPHQFQNKESQKLYRRASISSKQDMAEFLEPDQFLINLVENHRKEKDHNFDSVNRWKEAEWEPIRIKWCKKFKSKITWKNLSKRYKEIIVKKFNERYPITGEHIHDLRARDEKTLQALVLEVFGKGVKDITFEDVKGEPKVEMVAQDIILPGDRFDTRYGISEQQYRSLNEELLKQFDEIRKLVWSYAFSKKSEYPLGSYMRNFWTLPIVRKEVLLQFALVCYEKRHGISVQKECLDLLIQMKTL